MAVVKIYFGADGSDANDGTTRAQRVQSKARVKALVAAIGGGNTPRLMGEGVLWRGVTGWVVNGGTFLDLLSTDTNMNGVQLSSTSTEDVAAIPLEICDYRVITSAGSFTDTGTTTTRGTKIWVATGALSSAAGGGRVWGADFTTNSNYNLRELWEGGANYTATFTNIHPNLDIIPGLDVAGDCWTCYDNTGALTANLYIACAQNPVTRYGAISMATRESFAVLSLSNLTSAKIDPEVTIRGGGTFGVYVAGCNGTAPGGILVEPKVVGQHAYGQPVAFDGNCSNIQWSPYVDPLYARRVPWYAATATGHNVGSNQCDIKATCDLSAANGWPETAGATTGIIVDGSASNGRRHLIRDLFHAGVANTVPSGSRMHEYIRIRNVEFDFKNVMYGRAFAFGALITQARNIEVLDCTIRNQPTQSQMAMCGGRVRRNRFHSAPNVGDGYVSPWGGTSNKAGTSVGLACYTSTASDLADVLIDENEFDCEDGAFTVDTFNSVAWKGPVVATRNKIIRPGKPGRTDAIVTVPRAIGFSWQTSADQALMFMFKNINVGFSGSCVRRFQTSPSINDATTLDACLPVGQNNGWQHFADLEAHNEALRLGQLIAYL